MAIIRGTLGTTGGDLILAGAGNDTIFGDNFFGNGGGPMPPPYGGTPLPGNNLILAGAGGDRAGRG